MTNASRSSVTSGRDRLGGTFHRFWVAGVSTNFGDGLLAVALPLIAAALTQDPLLVAGLSVARFLPWLLPAPLPGVLLDRVDRLRALVVANTVAATTVALLAFALATGHATVWVLYAAMFVVMSCETVSDPASRLSVTRLVPRRFPDRANSRIEGGRLIAQEFSAAPVGALLFTVAAVIPVAGAAVSYALCAMLLGLGVSYHAAVAVVLLVGLGLCMTVSNIAGTVFFQSVVPDRIRARAGNVHRAVTWGATPLGALLGGLLGRVDLGLPYLVGGAFFALVVLCNVRVIIEASDLCDRAVAEQGPSGRN